MGSNRPPTLSFGGLRGPDAAQAASYAGAAYPLRGSNPESCRKMAGEWLGNETASSVVVPWVITEEW